MGLWKSEEDKLNRSRRKWKGSLNYMPYRYAELFREDCGVSRSIATSNITTNYTEIYTHNCIERKLVPNEVKIVADKITATDGCIQIDISKPVLDNINSIVINDVKYVKES